MKLNYYIAIPIIIILFAILGFACLYVEHVEYERQQIQKGDIFIKHYENRTEMFRIEAMSNTYNNSRIVINRSYITNMTELEDRIIIEVDINKK